MGEGQWKELRRATLYGFRNKSNVMGRVKICGTGRMWLGSFFFRFSM